MIKDYLDSLIKFFFNIKNSYRKFYQNSKTSWPNKDLKDVKIISQKILFVYSKKNIITC